MINPCLSHCFPPILVHFLFFVASNKERYGRWQSHECSELKHSLLQHEEKSLGGGRHPGFTDPEEVCLLAVCPGFA